MRFTRILVAVMVLAGFIAHIVRAQTVDTIGIGESKEGAVNETTLAPSYFFDAAEHQVLTVRITATTDGFSPVLLIADSNNQMLETFSAALGEKVVGGTLTIPATGRYFIQVQGSNGSRGEFTLILLEGDIPIYTATPTLEPTAEPTETVFETTTEATPETTPATPTTQENPLTVLAVGDSVELEMDADSTLRQYTLASGESAIALEVRGGSSESQFSVSLTNNTTNNIVGLYQSPLEAAIFVLPPGTDTYTLVLQHGAFESAETALAFAIAVSEYNPSAANAEAVAALPTAAEPSVTPTATLPPTPFPTETPQPQDIDVILSWGVTTFMMTNISGAPIDVRLLAFTGNNRSADSSYWAQSNPYLPLDAFPPETCAGFRPLAYPENPTLPPGCYDLAAWWSADRVYFWGSAEFDVLFNGTVIATCATIESQCGVDLPNA